MTLILQVTLGCLPPYSEPVSPIYHHPLKDKKMFSQEGERHVSGTDLGPHYPAGAAGRGTGWPARGGQASLLEAVAFTFRLSLLLPPHRLPADWLFFSYLRLHSLSCQPPCPGGLWNFLHLCPHPSRVGGGWQLAHSWVPAFTILWLGRYYLLIFPAISSLGGKVATGNWPRICLPQFSNAPSHLPAPLPLPLSSSPPLATPPVSSIPPVTPEAI